MRHTITRHITCVFMVFTTWAVVECFAQPEVFFQSSIVASSTLYTGVFTVGHHRSPRLIFSSQFESTPLVMPIAISEDDGFSWRAGIARDIRYVNHNAMQFGILEIPNKAPLITGSTAADEPTLLELATAMSRPTFVLRSRDSSHSGLGPGWAVSYLGGAFACIGRIISMDSGSTWKKLDQTIDGNVISFNTRWERCEPFGLVTSVGDRGVWYVASATSSIVDSTDIPPVYGDFVSVTHGPTVGKTYRSFRRQPSATGLVFRRPHSAPWQEVRDWVTPNGDTLEDGVPLSIVGLRDSAIAMTFRGLDSLVIVTNDTIRYVDVGTRGDAIIVDIDDLVLLFRHNNGMARRVTLGSISTLDMIGETIDAPMVGMHPQLTHESIISYIGLSRVRWSSLHQRWLNGGLVYDVNNDVSAHVNFLDIIPRKESTAIVSRMGLIHVPVERHQSLVVPGGLSGNSVRFSMDHVEQGAISAMSVSGVAYLMGEEGVFIVDSALRSTQRLGRLRDVTTTVGLDAAGRLLAAGRRLHRYDSVADVWDTTSIVVSTDDMREMPAYLGRLVTTADGTLLAGRRGLVRFSGSDSTRLRSGGIIRSTDNGATWTRVSPAELGEYVYDLTMAADGTLWATMANMTEIIDASNISRFLRDTIRIVRSTDMGRTWMVDAERYLSSTSFDDRTFSISTHPTLPAVVVTWPEGVEYRLANNDQWQRYDELPFATVVNAARFGLDGLLYFATQNGCVYRTDITVNSNVNEGNQASSSVTTSLHSDGSGTVVRITSLDVLLPDSIVVHDITGRRLPTELHFVSDHVLELRLPLLTNGLYVVSGQHHNRPFATTFGVVR